MPGAGRLKAVCRRLLERMATRALQSERVGPTVRRDIVQRYQRTNSEESPPVHSAQASHECQAPEAERLSDHQDGVANAAEHPASEAPASPEGTYDLTSSCESSTDDSITLPLPSRIVTVASNRASSQVRLDTSTPPLQVPQVMHCVLDPTLHDLQPTLSLGFSERAWCMHLS